MALVSILAPRCGGNREQIDRLFRGSKLYPLWSDKWERLGENTISKALEFSPAPPTTLDVKLSREAMTDIGNASRFVARFGHQVRYVNLWKSWLIWDGKRWAKDELGRVVELGKEAAIAILAEAASVPVNKDESSKDRNESWRNALAAWAKTSSSKGKIDAMLSMAQTDPQVAISPSALDADAWMINTQSGVVNLRTGKVRKHDPDLLMTKITNANADSEAECPLFDEFMASVVPDEQERRFIQKCVGYSLTGDVAQEVMLFCYGTGRNGKSTLLNTLFYMLGDYAGQINVESLMATGNGQSNPNNEDFASLHGKRLVITDELEQGKRLNEAKLKRITSKDPITAARKYEHQFTFAPTHKLWMYGNHKPDLRAQDEGTWRRIRILPFVVQIPSEQVDTELERKLRDGRDYVFRWAVQGLQLLTKEGLTPPAAVKDALDEYRKDTDTAARFVDECCTSAPQARIQSQALYNSYKDWCANNGEYPMKQKDFRLRLIGLGYTPSRKASGTVWEGIESLREPDTAHHPYSSPPRGIAASAATLPNFPTGLPHIQKVPESLSSTAICHAEGNEEMVDDGDWDIDWGDNECPAATGTDA